MGKIDGQHFVFRPVDPADIPIIQKMKSKKTAPKFGRFVLGEGGGGKRRRGRGNRRGRRRGEDNIPIIQKMKSKKTAPKFGRFVLGEGGEEKKGGGG